MENHDTSTKMKTYKYSFVYITICNHPEKYGMMYIGSHAQNNDDYLGSGSLLRYYIKKFGRQYFKRTIIQSYVGLTLEELHYHENLWIYALDAVNSHLFWNQKTRASGGWVVKDAIVHSEKTKLGMRKRGGIEKIQAHARSVEGVLKSKRNLLKITDEHREKAIENRSSNGIWLQNIIQRNKIMALDPVWRTKHKEGLLSRDSFIMTPVGVFKNATDAAIAFLVTNAAILQRTKSDQFPEWKKIKENHEHYIEPSSISDSVKEQWHRLFFTKRAHNKVQVTINGVNYTSKAAARSSLGWSQSRLENHLLKQENKNDR